VVFFGFSAKFENWDDGESIIATSVAGAGVIFGPGVGHAYAGNGKRMLSGALIRGVLLGFIPAAVAFRTENEGDESFEPGMAVLISPALASAVYDIATADRSVARYNQSHGSPGVSIAPSRVGSNRAYGLTLNLSLR
jgi:hypothetical protein